MPDDKANGSYSRCEVGEDWHQFLEDFSEAKKSCKELHAVVGLILANTGYLVKLPALTESVDVLSIVMKEMKESLLAPAIGQNRVPTDTVNLLLEAQNKAAENQNKNARYIFWLLGSVIAGYTLIFGLLLTGEKIGVINPLQHKITGSP